MLREAQCRELPAGPQAPLTALRSPEKQKGSASDEQKTGPAQGVVQTASLGASEVLWTSSFHVREPHIQPFPRQGLNHLWLQNKPLKRPKQHREEGSCLGTHCQARLPSGSTGAQSEATSVWLEEDRDCSHLQEHRGAEVKAGELMREQESAQHHPGSSASAQPTQGLSCGSAAQDMITALGHSPMD